MPDEEPDFLPNDDPEFEVSTGAAFVRGPWGGRVPARRGSCNFHIPVLLTQSTTWEGGFDPPPFGEIVEAAGGSLRNFEAVTMASTRVVYSPGGEDYPPERGTSHTRTKWRIAWPILERSPDMWRQGKVKVTMRRVDSDDEEHPTFFGGLFEAVWDGLEPFGYEPSDPNTWPGSAWVEASESPAYEPPGTGGTRTVYDYLEIVYPPKWWLDPDSLFTEVFNSTEGVFSLGGIPGGYTAAAKWGHPRRPA